MNSTAMAWNSALPRGDTRAERAGRIRRPAADQQVLIRGVHHVRQRRIDDVAENPISMEGRASQEPPGRHVRYERDGREVHKRVQE